MEYKDYYQTLGVAKNATAEEIKKAYRKLMRKHHPDVNQAQDASDQAKEVNEAYDVLGDAEKRAAYNARSRGVPGARPFQPPPGWGGNGNVDGDDFFFDLFAHAGQRSRQAGAYNMRGDDIHASISIDLADTYSGATRTVTLRVPQRDAGGKVVNRERSFEVAIPRGVLAGQQLRVPRQGYQGSGRGAPGDLFLDIFFNPDPLYRVEERDVFARLAITPWEAALGAQIDVPTPCGQVQVSVPAGSQGGRKLRLKGRGIPAHPPGDLYLTLEVVLPPASTPEARALYQTMARDLAFNPRAGVRA